MIIRATNLEVAAYIAELLDGRAAFHGQLGNKDGSHATRASKLVTPFEVRLENVGVRLTNPTEVAIDTIPVVYLRRVTVME
jgi:hypothetical protein